MNCRWIFCILVTTVFTATSILVYIGDTGVMYGDYFTAPKERIRKMPKMAKPEIPHAQLPTLLRGSSSSSGSQGSVFPGILRGRSEGRLMSVDVLRRLAKTVADVQQQIHRLAGKEAVIDAKWSVKLAAVAEKLDPRITLSSSPNSWDYSALISNMSLEVKKLNHTRHVCPEFYEKPKLPFRQIGFVPMKCSDVPAFKSVLAVILPAMTWESDTVNFVVKQIRKYYDITIIAILSHEQDIGDSAEELTIKRANNSDVGAESKSINEIAKKIQTPYVLIATSLIHFNNQSSLERLVRVINELNHVKVAGGAARDLKGHWIHGCLQQRMANYHARYVMGYYHSKYECMYCDDMLTPFVTTTEFLRQIPFTTDLEGSSMFRDWFAKIRIRGYLTMVCPDVMFYVNRHSTMERKQWLDIAKKWSLEKITSFDNQDHVFECSLVGISCKSPLNIIKSYLLPPCCIAMMTKYTRYLADYGQKNNLQYELQAGSAMGAVKMDGYLPWDYDQDFVFECKDFKAWMRAKDEWSKKKCNASVNRLNKYITVHCPNFFLELYCHEFNNTSRQFLPAEYRNTPTSINYAGKSIVVSANPGLHVRNFYGIDSLKHAAHWRTLKLTKLGKAKGGYDSPGLFNSCRRPSHHSCLDHYPGDGNLPYNEPFLNL